jgi:hypothetical protein
MMQVLNERGGSVGDVRLVGPSGVVWLVTGSREGRTLRVEGATRELAWREAVRRAEADEALGPGVNESLG